MKENFSEMIEDSAKGSLTLLLGRMASTLISTVGVIIVARILGSTSYGLISIALIPINVAGLLINNGVPIALTNFIAEDRYKTKGENIRNIILSGYIINTAVGLITFSGLYLSADYLANDIFKRPELTLLIKILSISTLAQAWLNTSTAIITGFEHMEQNNIINIFQSLLNSTVGPILVFLGYGIIGAAYGNTAPILLTGLLGILIVAINLKKVNSSMFDSSYFKPIILYTTPVFVASILSGAFLQILNFILPLHVTPSEIGYYAAATNFTVLIGFLLTPINQAIFPLLSKLRPEDNIFQMIYNNVIKYEILAAYPIAAAVIALSSSLVNLFFGPDYNSSILIVKILMINYLFLGFGSNINGILINSQKKTEVNLRSTLLYLLIGIPFGLVLIPKYGILGFLATIIIAPKIGLLYSLYWIRKNIGIKLDLLLTGKVALSTILSYVVCVTVIRFTSSNVWLELIFGGCAFAFIYLISILATGSITSKNLEDIKRITEKNRLGKKFAGPILEVLIKIAEKTKLYTIK